MLAMLGPTIAAMCMWCFIYNERPPVWNWGRISCYGLTSLAGLLFWTLPGGIGLLLGDKFENPIPSYMWIGIAMMFFLGWFSGLGEESLLQLILAGIVILIPLICSNVLMGAFFGWIWFRTQSLPLLGWTHQWYDMTRDATITLLVGYGKGLGVTYLALPIIYMVCFVLFGKILREDGLTWRSLLNSTLKRESFDNSLASMKQLEPTTVD